jgi:hypothetical protein
MVLPREHSKRKFRFSFLIPDNASNLAFHFFDFAYGHITIPLKGDIEKAKKSEQEKSKAPPIRTKQLESNIDGIDTIADYLGQKAPVGWQFKRVRFLGRSMSKRGGRGDIVQLNAQKDLWLQVREGFLYAPQKVNEKFLRFFPDYLSSTHVIFLVPESEKEVNLIVRAGAKTFSMPVGGKEKLALPKPLSSWKDGDVAQFVLLGKSHHKGKIVLDLVAKNLQKDKGIELSPFRQFQLGAGKKSLKADKKKTESLAHGAKRKMVLPPGVSVRFLLVFSSEKGIASIKYRGIKSNHDISLANISVASENVGLLEAPAVLSFRSKANQKKKGQGTKTRKSADSSSASKESLQSKGPKKKSVATTPLLSSVDSSSAVQEVEPNDDPSKAMKIDKEHKYMVKGVLEAGDHDYFAIDIDGLPQLWDVNGAGEAINQMAYVGLNGRERVRQTPSRKTKVATIQNLYLLPGRHLFKIRSASKGKKGDYLFWLKPMGPPDPTGEREPNSQKGYAQKLLLGEEMHGQATEKDADQFRFSLSVPSKIRLSVMPDASKKIQANLSGNKIAAKMSVRSEKGEAVQNEGQLPSGDYVLNLRGTGAYRFLVEQLPPFFDDGALKEENIGIEFQDLLPTIAAFWHQSQKISTKMKLENRSESAKTFSIQSWASQADWLIIPVQKQVSLKARESLYIPVHIIAPPDVATGDSIEVWILAKGAGEGRMGKMRLTTSCDAPPVKPVEHWKVPPPMLGGLNVAWSALGASNPTTEKYPKEAYLFNAMTPNDEEWYSYVKSWEKNPPQLTVKLSGNGEAPVAGIILNPMGCSSGGDIPDRFELLLSSDGKTFSKVLDGRVGRRPVDQYFPLDKNESAQYARLKFLSTQSGGLKICLGEWKVVATPEFALWKNLGANLADPEKGGHVVWSSPLIAKHSAKSMLTESAEKPRAWLESDRANEWVVGFYHNRAAMISGLELVRSKRKSDSHPIKDLQLAVSIVGPLGPWTSLGRWKLGDKESTSFRLPSPIWARFVRFSINNLEKSGNLYLPETLRIIETKPGKAYRSILGEWGHYQNRSYYEYTHLNPEPDQREMPLGSGGTKKSPLALELGKYRSGKVSAGKDEEWYRITAPKGVNSLTLTLSGEPALKAMPSLYRMDGQEIPLSQALITAGQSRFRANIKAGEYLVHVVEPPRSVAIVWDQSGSVAKFLPNIYQALANFSLSITPNTEYANFLPFQDKDPRFLLEDWTDQPLQLLRTLNEYDRKDNSSNAELNLLKSVSELGKQKGSRMVIMLTDADSGGHRKSEELWMALRRVRPMIFNVELHRGQKKAKDHQNLMRDWSMSSGGHYSLFRTQRDLDVALDRAICNVRRPATYAIKAEAKYVKPPKPGAIEVKSGALWGSAIELILDASGSMYKKLKSGKTRISVAKSVLSKLVQDVIPKGTPLALRVYGHREEKSCRTDLEVPLSPLDPLRINKIIQKIEPKNRSKTPLADSIAKVVEDLKVAEGKKLVVLVSDGEESCGGDPLGAIQSLKESGMGVRLNIIGFAIKDAVLEESFKNWATIGGGNYFDAADEQELSLAMEQAMRPKFQVLSEEGAIVAVGIAGGSAIQVPTGKYGVKIFSLPSKTIENIVVKPGQKVTID